MIACDKCQELLDIQWDGDKLKDEEKEALQGHLKKCSACAQYQMKMDSMLNIAATLCEKEFDRSIEVSPLVLRPHGLRPFWVGVLATSGLAIVFMLGIFAGGIFQRNPSQAIETQVVRLVVPVAQAKRVEVVGDFTGWKNRIALSPVEDGMWVGEVKVMPGRYKYMIVVDDTALQPDPAAREIVDDGFGGKNSVLDVGGSI